jgi:hypothetical protein
MNSAWLSCEAETERTRHARAGKKCLSRSAPCLGIFTEHPREIVRRLVRPKTPFVPAPLQPIDFDAAWVSSDDPLNFAFESSPSAFADGFGDPTLATAFEMSFF